ncbi:hypothetical protein CSA37_03335 [Candidatus Fermentibacteria bacterium]|nr:MAG: hypothetical protein CSA37_03335 [Candidatus Fermentibacteria bacterium]
MNEWKDWAEGSDTGLWVNDSLHRVSVCEIARYGGDESMNPPFYKPEALDVCGDMIYIADGGTQKLVAINHNGEVVWETEGIGEGPGHFNSISQVDATTEIVAVSDIANARVDLFSIEGEWLNSVPVIHPYDIQIYRDTTVMVAKYALEGDNCFKIMNLSGDLLSSFGYWEEHGNGWSSNRDLHFAIKDSVAVLTSYYTDRIELYDINSEMLISSFTRELPFDYPRPENDNGFTTFSTVILDVYIGPERMINVVYRPFTPDKTVDLSSVEFGEMTVIDRFNYSGEYLDSYVIPDNATQVVYENNQLYSLNEFESTLTIYEVGIGSE